MKKLTAIFLILLLALAACGREAAHQPTGADHVTMTVSNVTSTGARLTIQDDNREPFVYGSWFQLQREKDGVWYEVKTKLSNYGFDEMGWLTDSQGRLTMDVDWEWLYGTLPRGHYRILKQAGTQMIGAECTLE